MGIFHTVAHELGHHLSVQRYGREGNGHGCHWKSTMEEVFGVTAARVHTSEHNQKPPKIKFQDKRIWDMWDLYQTWRLEGPDWKDPLVTKIIDGNY